MFNTYLQEKKKRILEALSIFLCEEKQQINSQNPWELDTLERLETYIQHGKMIRGTLVFLGHEIQKSAITPDVVLAAGAIELLHAGLLMHDDIMDNAKDRRGRPTMHVQYTDLMEQKQSRYPKNTGQSLAICSGDFALFLGYKLVSHLSDPILTRQILHICSDQLQTTAASQMQDIVFGASGKPIQHVSDILSLYEGKTGRYSILMPLLVGATIAGVPNETIRHIQKFSEALGIAYQLTDDTLDIFGNTNNTGKTIGTDLTEGKQTPYIFFLRELKQKEIDERITAIFSKGACTDADLIWTQQTIQSNHIDKKIDDLKKTYIQTAMESVTKIPMKTEQKQLITEFVEYLTNRIQ